jgi:alpha-L-arabinofuranosidase
VNSQNSRYWSAENPGRIHELPLHDKIWCLGCDECKKGNWAHFYGETVNAVRYMNNILRPFSAELIEEVKL